MGAPPANFNHCVKIFDMMSKEVEKEVIDGVECNTWEGFTTELFTRAEFPQPYYTFVMQKLQAMGCVVQLHRGGGGGPSKWLVLYEPTRELYDSAPDKPRGRPSRHDVTEQRHRDMLRRMGDLEKRLDAVEGLVYNA